eukprot:g26872.t1
MQEYSTKMGKCRYSTGIATKQMKKSYMPLHRGEFLFLRRRQSFLSRRLRFPSSMSLQGRKPLSRGQSEPSAPAAERVPEFDVEAQRDLNETTATYYPRPGGPMTVAGSLSQSIWDKRWVCISLTLALLLVLSVFGRWEVHVSGPAGEKGISIMWKSRSPVQEKAIATGNFPKSPKLPAGSIPFAVITDLDRGSKLQGAPDSKPEWFAYLKRGYLNMNGSAPTITWLDNKVKGVMVNQKINDGARGMELSELVVWKGSLLSPDDRTGVVYEIENPWAGIDGEKETPLCFPRYILADGSGDKAKGFKGEWMAVKDDSLYIGSHGREFTTGAKIESYDPEWVKTIDPQYKLEHHNWNAYFNKMRVQTGASFPGYLEHEAATWSPIRREWIFAPRRWSNESYDEEKNELRGWNKILRCTEDFSEILVVGLGMSVEPEKGFSSIKLIPGTNDELAMALRTLEREKLGIYSTTAIIFNVLSGEILAKDLVVDEAKYEGLAFL